MSATLRWAAPPRDDPRAARAYAREAAAFDALADAVPADFGGHEVPGAEHITLITERRHARASADIVLALLARSHVPLVFGVRPPPIMGVHDSERTG